MPKRRIAVRAAAAAPNTRPGGHPPELAANASEREKRLLCGLSGLRNFGANLTRLPPGAASVLRHAHAKQDESALILEGGLTLVTDAGETPLCPGMCAGDGLCAGDAHHPVDRPGADVLSLEFGDRTPGGSAEYPGGDLAVRQGAGGRFRCVRKDGTPIPETR